MGRFAKWLSALGLALFLAPSQGAHGAEGARHAAPGASEDVPEGLGTGDWKSIRQAYQAHRHAAFPVDGGYRARNPGQRWRTLFDGRGFTVEDDAGEWTFGLQLERYGLAGHERAVETPARVRTDAQRVAYDWGATLEEWFINDTRGLEHGYTVHERPPGGEGPLTFQLSVRGGLRPEVNANGRDVRMVDSEGATLLHYAGLTVFDADGRTLPARFERVPKGLRLTVDERGARYPVTIDPVVQQAYLKASNTDADDFFGISVAVSGDTVVVGASHEDSSVTGVNGDQSDNSAELAGAAYVFVRSGTIWSQQAYLKASNTDEGDIFGSSVAVSGDTVVVGAGGEGSSATGVNGDQADNSSFQAGAAYVFLRTGTTWSQQAYLKASNTNGVSMFFDVGDRFGNSVAVSGNTVVVGASGEDSNATGVNGDPTDNSAPGAGAAYVFVRSDTTWSQQAYLKASNTEGAGSSIFGDMFGVSVEVSGDTVVVGAWGEDSSATGVNGDPTDNSAEDSGAAYVFVRSGTTWSQQAYLKASNTGGSADGGAVRGDGFGFSVAVSGDTVVVGAPEEGSSATGVNGDQADNSSLKAGAAYVFVRAGTTWSQQAYLKASNTEKTDAFGASVAVSGDTVVVGADKEESNATGVNGDQTNNNAVWSGAAYLFVRSGTTWSQQAYLKASNTDGFDAFGKSVAVSGDTVVVGARFEDSSATGVNGDETDDRAGESGAVYVFDFADAAECFLLVGAQPTHAPLSGDDTLLTIPLLILPVTLETMPVFSVPDDPSLLDVHIYSQIYMNNPEVFPNDPIRFSNGVDTSLGSASLPSQYGPSSGLSHWASGPAVLGGWLDLRFSIDYGF